RTTQQLNQRVIEPRAPRLDHNLRNPALTTRLRHTTRRREIGDIRRDTLKRPPDIRNRGGDTRRQPRHDRATRRLQQLKVNPHRTLPRRDHGRDPAERRLHPADGSLNTGNKPVDDRASRTLKPRTRRTEPANDRILHPDDAALSDARQTTPDRQLNPDQQRQDALDQSDAQTERRADHLPSALSDLLDAFPSLRPIAGNDPSDDLDNTGHDIQRPANPIDHGLENRSDHRSQHADQPRHDRSERTRKLRNRGDQVILDLRSQLAEGRHDLRLDHLERVLQRRSNNRHGRLQITERLSDRAPTVSALKRTLQLLPSGLNLIKVPDQQRRHTNSGHERTTKHNGNHAQRIRQQPELSRVHLVRRVQR